MERENNQRKTNQCSVSTRRMNSNSNFHYITHMFLVSKRFLTVVAFQHQRQLLKSSVRIIIERCQANSYLIG